MMKYDSKKNRATLDPADHQQFSKDAVLRQGNFSQAEAADVAVEVLAACKVQPLPAKDFLRCGSGRLVGNPDTTIGEVYSRLGNNSRSTGTLALRSGLVV